MWHKEIKKTTAVIQVIYSILHVVNVYSKQIIELSHI